MITSRELEENENVDSFLEDGFAPLTQSYSYFTWQKSAGLTVRRFVFEEEGKIKAYFQALKLPLAFGKSFYYIPYGPVCSDTSSVLLAEIKKAIATLKSSQIVFVRLDFFIKAETKDLTVLKQYFFNPFRVTFKSSHFQPRQEWFLNLDKPIDTLLQETNKKTSYAIRVAEKRGVKVEIVNDGFMDYFDDFYSLLESTAQRNHFSLHPKKYYQHIFQDLDKSNNKKSFLSIAYFEDQILAIDLIFVFAGIANYVFGGSSGEHKSLSSPSLSHWSAIVKARELGCHEYNFGGVDIDNRLKGKWKGLTSHKVKFGGHLINHNGFYDMIFQRFWYYLYVLYKLFKS